MVCSHPSSASTLIDPEWPDHGEADAAHLAADYPDVTDDHVDVTDADAFGIAATTPVDHGKRTDPTPLQHARVTVGPLLRLGDLVVFEATVWPGLTEEVCHPILESAS